MLEFNKSSVLCLLNVFYIFISFEKVATNEIVKTTYGPIRGTISRTIQEPHFEYISFMGIPYAKPPVHTLRFKPPEKPKNWNFVKNCTSFGNSCLQVSQYDNSIVGNEDCLTLNVFTKSLVSSVPVMFWIHGGMYIRGSSSDFLPDYLITRDIVLVTINYRLNVFGFLSTQDSNAYGNAGLKDQLLALEWIQENIAKFGGDPLKVTVFGQSSGANSISLLQFSPKAKGLFQQIIRQSGSALNARYLQRNPLQHSYNIAKYFNISTTSTKKIVEGLQKIEAKELTRAGNMTEATGFSTYNFKEYVFCPVIEVNNSAAIITRSAYKLLKSGNFHRVPFITGFNSNEGIGGLKTVTEKKNLTNFNINYKLFSSTSFNNDEKSVEIGKRVRNYFLGNARVEDDIESFIQFLGEEMYIRSIVKHLELIANFSKGYMYRFSYKGTYTSNFSGVAHSEELQYIFPNKNSLSYLKTTDIQTRKRLVELWTNFAIFGNPTPSRNSLLDNLLWEKTGTTKDVYLDIGNTLILRKNVDQKNYDFWNKLFEQYGQPPYLTY